MNAFTTEIANDVAIIRIDDGKANAVSQAFLSDMHAALDRAETEAKAVVIIGRPERFSAGFDLKVMREDPSAAAKLVNDGGKLMLRIFEHKQPVVAACTGHALAAGALLLLSCDTRIGAAGDFKIGLNETAIGMTLPQFGIELPRARLKQDRFTEAVIQAKIFSPDEAKDAGFLDIVTTPEQVEASAIAAAEMLAQLPGGAYAGNKRLIRKPAIDAIRASLA
ncbi:MAG: crotonase/enoyl-CoA hydratase family protein [Pseudomonadota bacterium]